MNKKIGHERGSRGLCSEALVMLVNNAELRSFDRKLWWVGARMAWRRSPNSQALHSESQLRRSLSHRSWRTLRFGLLKSELGQALSGQTPSGDDGQHTSFTAARASPNVYVKGALKQRGEV